MTAPVPEQDHETQAEDLTLAALIENAESYVRGGLITTKALAAAEDILASDWLARVKREAAERAYEQGREDGRGDMEALERRWRAEALREAAGAVMDECSASRERCFCSSASWLRARADRLEGATDE